MSVSAFLGTAYLVKFNLHIRFYKTCKSLNFGCKFDLMLFQLRATADEVRFAALVCTCPSDLRNLSELPTDSYLSKHYPSLKQQVAEHLEKGLVADFTYPWPLVNAGFARFEASRVFYSWQEQGWMAYSEDGTSLLDSPLQRKTLAPGHRLFKGLYLIRRIKVHPLLMVRIPDGMSRMEHLGHLIKPSFSLLA